MNTSESTAKGTHTPGPWAPDINGEIWTRTSPTGAFNRRIATVNLEVFDCGANARLIAAAPEMLAVIKMLMLHTPADCDNYGAPEARALLARIEG